MKRVDLQGVFKPVFYLFTLAALFLLSSPIAAEDQSLFRRLDELSHHHYWHTLMHYRKAGRGWKSEVVSENFFLSEHGKTDPVAEIKKNWELFFVKKDRDAITHFPARYRWLKKMIGTTGGYPEEQFFSDEYRAYRKASAEIVTVHLLFATDYLGRPESVYGHTLLLFETKDDRGLLGQSLNFAASARGASSFDYIFKGVFGGFPGVYHLSHYYEKVNLYTYAQSRDLWEYELEASPEDIAMLMDHLWELDHAELPYYFFSANCAYNILYLVDLLDTDESLVARCKPWVSPVDTIHIVEEGGLIRQGGHYRPSVGARFRAAERGLGEKQRDRAFAIARGEYDIEDLVYDTAFTEGEKSEILDLALVYYHYNSYPIADEREEYEAIHRQTVKLAAAKSRLPLTSVRKPLREDPLEGHPPLMMAFGCGYSFGAPVLYFKLRPSYHSFSDPFYGYTRGGEIVFPALSLFLEPGETVRVRLDELTIAAVTSIKPIIAGDAPISWRASAAIDDAKPVSEDYGLTIRGGVGPSFELTPLLWMYLFGDLIGRVEEKSNLAPACAMGLLLAPCKYVNLQGEGGVRQYLIWERVTLPYVEGALVFRLGKQSALTLEGEYYFETIDDSLKLLGGGRIYF